MDSVRDELKRSEEETAVTRHNLEKERQKFELAEEQHRKALDEMHERQHVSESERMKREEELQRRIHALESDLQVFETNPDCFCTGSTLCLHCSMDGGLCT